MYEELDVETCERFLAERFFIVQGDKTLADISFGQELRRSPSSMYFWENFRNKLRTINQEGQHAVIAGGSILNSYHQRNYFTSDIDLYIHENQAEQMVRWLLSNHHIALGSIVAPAYDQSFFRKNNIISRTRFIVYHCKRKMRYESWEEFDARRLERATYLDLMIIPNDMPITTVVTNFDLTFCQVWYDGTAVYSDHKQDVLSKRGRLQPAYTQSLFHHFNQFIVDRISKYRQRGYQISYDNPSQPLVIREPPSKRVLNWEEWLCKFFYYFIRRMICTQTESLIEAEAPHLLHLEMEWIPDTEAILYHHKLYQLSSSLFLCTFPLYPYNKEKLDQIITMSGLLESYRTVENVYLEGIKECENFYMNKQFAQSENEYVKRINGWLGFSPDQHLVFIDKYYNDHRRRVLLNDLRKNRTEYDNDIRDRSVTYPFAKISYDEPDDSKEQGTCIDTQSFMTKSLHTYLQNHQSYLFISGQEILCMTYQYLYEVCGQEGKWLYECKGDYITPEHHQNGKYNNKFDLLEPYCLMVINSSGEKGVVPSEQLLRIVHLQAEYEKRDGRLGLKRVYHLIREKDVDGNNKTIHNMSQRSSFDIEVDYGEQIASDIPHCQHNTRYDVYNITSCVGEVCSLTNKYDFQPNLEGDDESEEDDENEARELNFDDIDDVSSEEDSENSD
jgi:hypothetical protein